MLQFDLLAEEGRVVEGDHGVPDALRVREQNEGECLLSARLLVPGDSDLLQGPGIKEQLVENPVINLLRETCVYILTRNPYFA